MNKATRMDFRPRPMKAAFLALALLVSLFIMGHNIIQTSHAAGGMPPPESPEVLPDHRVTFRLEAPHATTVKLRGIQRVQIDLNKDPKGIWSTTVGPLPHGIYGYSFIVDGEPMLDPSNPLMKPERDPETSLLEVVTNPPLFYQWQDVPHGTVRLHDYKSKALHRLRRLRVYTPPTYDKDPVKRFPVLYLLHGTGDTEATWTEFGRAHYILDNLLAEHKSVPMLIVMMDGHADLADEEGIDARNLDEFEADLLQSVVPLVEENYRTRPDRDHRAICGLSMGGIQSLSTGLRHPDIFAWIGGMSAWVPNAEKRCTAAFNDPHLNEKVRLLWNQMGAEDPYLPDYKEFETVLEKHGVHRSFKLTPGDHTWPLWREYLHEFAQVLFR
jgi:enterochelin esterase family protein